MGVTTGAEPRPIFSKRWHRETLARADEAMALVRTVAKVLDIPTTDITGTGRCAPITRARTICYMLLHHHRYTNSQIGWYLRRRESTVGALIERHGRDYNMVAWMDKCEDALAEKHRCVR